VTPREIEVLGALGNGMTNKEVARLLAISPHTVQVPHRIAVPKARRCVTRRGRREGNAAADRRVLIPNSHRQSRQYSCESSRLVPEVPSGAMTFTQPLGLAGVGVSRQLVWTQSMPACHR